MDDDFDEDAMVQAIMCGTIVPPGRNSSFAEAVRFRRGQGKLGFLAGRGRVISLPSVLSFVIPFVVFLMMILIAGLFLPDGTWIVRDWILAPGFAFLGAIMVRYMVMSRTSFGEASAHLAKQGINGRYLIRASLPERFWKFDLPKVQIIRLVSCTPSPVGGPSGLETKVVPAIITRGMRPMSHYPYEEDPVNNDIIADPVKCADESHENLVIDMRDNDKFEEVDVRVKRSVDDYIEEVEFERIEYATRVKSDYGAINPFNPDRAMAEMAEERGKEAKTQ